MERVRGELFKGVWILRARGRVARVDRKEKKEKTKRRSPKWGSNTGKFSTTYQFFFFHMLYYSLHILGIYFGVGIGALETLAYSCGI